MSLALRPKVLIVLLDGLGDVGACTPLQEASTPWMDRCVATGMSGLMDPVEPGLACGSDTAHLALFGYDPRRFYRGRGAFETMGTGLEMAKGDIAFKSNFAVVDEGEGENESGDGNDVQPLVLSRRADRCFEEEGPVLCAALDGITVPGYPEYSVTVRYATEHRCAVRVHGPRLSDRITGTDPLKDGLPLRKCVPVVVAEDDDNGDTDDVNMDAVATSAFVNALSSHMRTVLQGHPVNVERRRAGKPPANAVLLRGCGMRLDVPPLEQRHPWLFEGTQPSNDTTAGDSQPSPPASSHAFAIAPTCIIAGLAQTIGMNIVRVPGATGDYRTCLLSKARAAVHALREENYTFGFLHVKAVDDAGHDGRRDLKRMFLERADQDVVAAVLRGYFDGQAEGGTTCTRDALSPLILVITGDHSTPVAFGDHSHEPVPFVICDGETVLRSSMDDNDDDDDMHRKHTAAFDEVAAGRGVLGRFPGSECFTVIQRFAQWRYGDAFDAA